MKKIFTNLMLLAASTMITSNLVAQTDQWHPDNTVRIIVPFGAGGSTDIIARAVAPRLEEEIGQPVVIVNRGGASGAIGARAQANAATDGLTIGISTVTTHSSNAIFVKNLPYNPKTDFRYIITLVQTPKLIVVHDNVPAENISELIASANRAPNGYFYAANQSGVDRLYGETFKLMSDSNITLVPYNGSSEIKLGLLGEHVEIAFDTLPSQLSHMRNGQVRALAFSWHERLEEFPDVPTWAELGYPDLNHSTWYGVVVPSGTPDRIVNGWNKIFQEVLKDQTVQRLLTEQTAYVVADTPEEAEQRVAATTTALEAMVETLEIEKK